MIIFYLHVSMYQPGVMLAWRLFVTCVSLNVKNLTQNIFLVLVLSCLTNFCTKSYPQNVKLIMTGKKNTIQEKVKFQFLKYFV